MTPVHVGYDGAPGALAIVTSQALVAEARGVMGTVHQVRHPSEILLFARPGAVRVVLYEAGVFDRMLRAEYASMLHLAAPTVPILVCWRGNADAMDEVARLVATFPTAAPVHERYNLRDELLKAASGMRNQAVAAEAIRAIRASNAEGTVDHCVAAAVMVSQARQSVPDLSSVTGMSVRSLSRHCRVAQLPRPVSLLGWARALHVIHALEVGRESLQRIAVSGGEASARECADYVRYHTGRAPTSWLTTGGFNALLTSFTAQVMPPSAHPYLKTA